MFDVFACLDNDHIIKPLIPYPWQFKPLDVNVIGIATRGHWCSTCKRAYRFDNPVWVDRTLNEKRY